jgi:ketosteroid isomerase-like protein
VSSNLDLVHSIFADWERGDYSAVEWAHADIEFVWVGGLGDGGDTWTGVTGMADGWRAVLSAFDDWRAVPDEIRELDDERVLVLLQASGRGKASGAPIHHRGATLFHVRGGKVVQLVAYPDRDRALADLGLEE